jgi:LacI family transcriptional regulator
MTTIRDVAKQAGVAPITVSRVINNSGYISRETRDRVEAAIAELQYVPNSLARSLRSKQTRTIALVLTDITNPFFTTMARGVEDIASKQRFNVIFCNTDESEAKQQEYLTILLQKQVDGILLVPVQSKAEPVKLIQRQGVEVVVVDRRVPYNQVDVVRTDSEKGAYQLTQYLLSLGHKEIAILTGPDQVSTAIDRVSGYRRALIEVGLKVKEHFICYSEFTQASGYEMMRRVLALAARPTAVFAANNFIALGALRAFREAGLRAPEDIALVAFDDLPPSLIIDPFLTAASQPSYEMGQRAAELLLARLTGERFVDYQEVILPTEIIVRGSSGPPLNGRHG